MKTEKSRKRERSESPKSKTKRRYRNDRSKKWQATSSSEESSDQESKLSSDEYSSDDEKRTSSKKRKQLKQKKRSKKRDVSSDDDSVSSSSSPERPKKLKKKSSRRRSSDSDDSDDLRKKTKKKSKKHSHISKKRRKRSLSVSPPRKSRTKNRSKSPSRKKKSRSRTPSRKKKSRSRTPSRKKKSRSRTPPRKKKSRSRTPSRKKKSRSRTPVREKKSQLKISSRKKKSLSKSPVRKKHRSISPKRRSRSKSPKRKSRSRTPKRRSRSKSPKRRSRSKSPKHRRNKSKSSSPLRKNKQKSSSPERKPNKNKSPSRDEHNVTKISSRSKERHLKSKEQSSIKIRKRSTSHSPKPDKADIERKSKTPVADITNKIKNDNTEQIVASMLPKEIGAIVADLKLGSNDKSIDNISSNTNINNQSKLSTVTYENPVDENPENLASVGKEKEGAKRESVVLPVDTKETCPSNDLTKGSPFNKQSGIIAYEVKQEYVDNNVIQTEEVPTVNITATSVATETIKADDVKSEIPLLGKTDNVPVKKTGDHSKQAAVLKVPEKSKIKIEKIKVQVVSGIKTSNRPKNVVANVFAESSEKNIDANPPIKEVKIESETVFKKTKSRDRYDDHKKNKTENKSRHSKDDKYKSENDGKRRDSKTKRDDRDSKSSKRDKSPERKNTVGDIEDAMKKRKERIEQWRNERKKQTGVKDEEEENNDQKKWSLEDDEDEDESSQQNKKENNLKNKSSGQQNKKETNLKNKSSAQQNGKQDVEMKEESEDDDLDPLDAYMKTISKDVNKPGKGKSGKDKSSKVKTVTVVKTVVKKSNVELKLKPEVMEQNQDALEYSSEEELPADVTATDFTEATKRKKEFVVADHTKIYYASFRRDFYVEVPELSKMSSDEVKFYRETLGDIQVRGKTIPKPIKTWSQAGLSSKVMSILKKLSYVKPTPIQAQAIPVIMSGRDMIGIAKTGSGKTLAFLLPMLRHVLDQPSLEESDGPIAIIMTPTRELALQIYRESRKFCKHLNLSCACIYGGSGISEQIAELKKGAEIIVCTPGRMIDMLAANSGKVTNCRRCTYLVLDEADRMFDMGFEPQVMRILDNIRPDRQTVLFSATFPRQMEAVARKVLAKPIEIQVGGRSIVCSDIEQHALVLDADNKFLKLLELLGVYHENGSILVFVEKQDTADVLFKDLLKKGYPCLSLHGGMDQFDRDSTIADFKNGVMTIMVSTSVAARGLDVKNLILVINYDCPNHYEDYVHRVGRTGRAGKKGTAFTFLTYEQGRNAGDIVKAFELSKCEAPADVTTLWNGYKEEMEKEGKTVKVNSGFSGKGFKFNADEAAQVHDAKKMQKFALGLQDSDDEAEAAENAMDKIEADLEKAFSNKPKVALAPDVKEAHEAQMKVVGQNVDKGKLKQASDMAALLNRKLSSGQIIDRNTTATANIMQGVQLESLKGVGLAKQLADKVNAKLNYKAVEPEKEKEEEKQSNVRYEEEIDLNDFPQQARWRITSKEIIEQVRELSEAGITVRGVYIPPNKNPEEDEKRLHLYIESLSERSIQIAKAEIKRLLKEELIRTESNSYRSQQQTGRYKVV